MNWFGRTHTQADEDQLNADLDRMIRGHSPDGPLGATVERVFQLGAQEGLTSPRALTWLRPATPPDNRPNRSGASRMFNPKTIGAVFSVTSTAAIFAVVFAMTFGGFNPSLPDRNTNKDSQFLAAPSQSPNVNGVINQDVPIAEFRLLTPDDCTVEPRTREDMLGTLSITPIHPYIATNVVRDAPAVPLTQADYDEMQEAYFQWQACTFYFMTWQAAALTSDDMLRRTIYTGYAPAQASLYGPFSRPYSILSPFSEDTLNNILDSWEAADFPQYESLLEVGASGTAGYPRYLRVMVPNVGNFTFTEVGVIAPIITIDETGSSEDLGWTVIMVKEDGQWRVDFEGGLG